MRIEENFIDDIKSIAQSGRNDAYAAINDHMLETFWRIGEMIVMDERKRKAESGDGQLWLEELSKQLTTDLGKGFTIANLKEFRQFYLMFPDKPKN